VIDRQTRRLGLEWEYPLLGWYLHDGHIQSVAFAYGFRDVTVRFEQPHPWDRDTRPLPNGFTHDRLEDMRLTFRFKDVADFRIEHTRQEEEVTWEDGKTTYETYSYLESPCVSSQTIHFGSVVDADLEGIRTASETHGGTFRSVRMELVGGAFINLVFRDCLCTPSDWDAYEAWVSYPFGGEMRMPTIRTTPSVTSDRYVRENWRHVCTTHITWDSDRPSRFDDFHLCDACLGEWIEDFEIVDPIPQSKSGSGRMKDAYGRTGSWARGRFPGQRCQCEIRRPAG